MAKDIRYIRRRDNGVYQYERRIPQAIIERPDLHQAHFGGKALYRRSLGTKFQTLAMQRAAAVHEEFEQIVALAGGVEPPTGSTEMISDRNTKPVTPALLKKVEAEFRQLTRRPWTQALLWVETSPDHREMLEDMIADRERSAQELRAYLIDLQPTANPTFPKIDEIAQRIIEDELLDAPKGTAPFAAVCRAVREGLIAGEREVDKLLQGDKSLIASHEGPVQEAPRISEVVAAHAATLPKGRSVMELNGALRRFVAMHGDLRLDEIQRSHFLDFCRVEGARTVGGQHSDSIERPISSSTLQKKVGLLRAAINRAIKTGWYAGANPAAQIDAAAFTKPAPKRVMPEKRPFEIEEINAILKHPWFTGCQSASNTHAPGKHRLEGMHFWVPILALYTGCRAGELAGLKLSEILLDDQFPHFVIQSNEYRTTKSGKARRVPVLDALMSLGFADFVESKIKRNHDRLFEDWLPPRGKIEPNETAWANGQLLRAFNRTVVPHVPRQHQWHRFEVVI